MEAIFALALGYLIGSVPFGLILTRLSGAGDLRNIGSGNIGATNVLRTGNKGLAALTLLLDAAKGVLAVWLGAKLFPAFFALSAIGVVLGHCFPVWLRFRGGKGVATLFGVALALAWPVGLAYALVWLAVAGSVRISSLAGISAAIAAPLAAWLTGHADLVLGLALLTALVVWQHRANIARLIAGTEPKIGAKPE